MSQLVERMSVASTSMPLASRFCRVRHISRRRDSQYPHLGIGHGNSRPVTHTRQRIHITASSLNPVAPSSEAGPGFLQRIWYRLRGLGFGIVTIGFSAPCFLFMLLLSPFVLLFDRHRRSLYAHVNAVWARVTAALFFEVNIHGKENLPNHLEPAVYVSNHQSYTDIIAILCLARPVKFISKSAVFLFPFIGWSMAMTGHIRLNRSDRKSQLKCLRDCEAKLSNGVPIILFPEGTRSADKKLQPFKKGAFTIAVKSGVPIVPITLNGTGDLMTKGRELELYSGSVDVVVHPKIETRGRTAADVCDEARTVIASALRLE